MTRGDIIDMHNVESGIHVGRHSPGGRVQDHLTGRGWFDISRADGGRWIDNDHRRACLRGLPYELLGQKFRAFVVADHVGDTHRRVFRAGRPVSRDTHGGYAARVNNTRHACLACGFENIPGTFDVGSVQLPRIGRAQPVVGSHMKKGLAVAQRTVQGRSVGQITFSDFERQIEQVAPVG